MFPYWVLFGVSAVAAVQIGGKSRQLRRAGILLGLFSLIIFLMIGLRFEVGGDWINYLRIYDSFRHSDLGETLSRFDPAYSLLNWIALRLGFGIWFVNVACAAIFTWGLVRFAAQQLNPWLAIVVAIPYLVIVVAMGYTRQAVAIGFILSGLASMRRGGSITRFAFYGIAAALFHRTAIIVLPLVALAVTRNRWISVALIVALVAILFYLLVDTQFETLVQNYVVAQYDAQGAGIRIAMNVAPAVLFLSMQRRFSVDESDRRLWRNFALASLAAMVLLMANSVVGGRGSAVALPYSLAASGIFAAAVQFLARTGRQRLAHDGRDRVQRDRPARLAHLGGTRPLLASL